MQDLNALNLRIIALEFYVDRAVDNGKLTGSDYENALNEKANAIEKGIICADFSSKAYAGLWHKYLNRSIYCAVFPMLIAVWSVLVIGGSFFLKGESLDNISFRGLVFWGIIIWIIKNISNHFRDNKLRELNRFYLPPPPNTKNGGKGNFNVPPQDE